MYTASYTRKLAPSNDLIFRRLTVNQVASSYISCKPFSLTIQHALCYPGSFHHSNISYRSRSNGMTETTVCLSSSSRHTYVNLPLEAFRFRPISLFNLMLPPFSVSLAHSSLFTKVRVQKLDSSSSLDPQSSFSSQSLAPLDFIVSLIKE